MRIPDRLASLVDNGIIDEVVRPLMSGKEAQVYLVLSGGQSRVAKVYKEAQNRSFKHRATYTEGRRVRNSRDQRAIDNRSRHGKAQDESAWQSTEVQVIQRLHAAGVRVPTPYAFIDGVLVMEMVQDAEGNPAPRLADVPFSREEALTVFDKLIREVVRMLCAGIVHGDLSDFNVLIDANGPVVIDFPQAIDASSNANARVVLQRDVANLYRFLEQFVPGRPPGRFAEEMWNLYQRGELFPDSKLSGLQKAVVAQKPVDTRDLMRELELSTRDEERRRAALGLPPLAQTQRRVVVDIAPPRAHVSPPAQPQPQRAPEPRRWEGGNRGGGPPQQQPQPPQQRAPQPQQRAPQHGHGHGPPAGNADRRGPPPPPPRPQQGPPGEPAREQRAPQQGTGGQRPPYPQERSAPPNRGPQRPPAGAPQGAPPAAQPAWRPHVRDAAPLPPRREFPSTAAPGQGPSGERAAQPAQQPGAPGGGGAGGAPGSGRRRRKRRGPPGAS